MAVYYSLFISVLLSAFHILPKEPIQKKANSTIQEDSLVVWVSQDFETAIQKDISICQCWKNTKYHLLHFDSVNSELYLRSNLMHHGHDSDLIFPLKKAGNYFVYDSTLNDWPVREKRFQIPQGDTLILFDGDQAYGFHQRVLPFNAAAKKHLSKYAFLRTLFYKLNSQLLLKYEHLDAAKSVDELFTYQELKSLIKSGKVQAHCSDDFHLDGITVTGDTNRYFQLEFSPNQVTFFEHKGRNKGETLNLPELPKQVMTITK